MQKAFAAFRTIAALALMLSLVAGLLPVRGVGAQGVPPSGDPVASEAPVIVEEPVVSAEPEVSAEPDASADPDASAEPVPEEPVAPSLPPSEREVLEDGAVITGTIVEDDDRAGEYDYLIDSTSAQAEGDIRYAGAGEHYYYVVIVTGGVPIYAVIDEGPTDDQGMVTLDIPATGSYFIYEAGELGDGFFGSDGVEGPATFLAVEYVSVSGTASTVPSPVGSGDSGSGDSGSGDSGSGDSGSGDSGSGDSGSGGGSNGGDGSNGDPTGATTGGGTTTGTATSLPNTGAGDSESGSAMTWMLFALMAVAGLAATIIFGLRRNT